MKVMKPVYFKIPLWFRMLDQPSQFMMARKAKLLPHWWSSNESSSPAVQAVPAARVGSHQSKTPCLDLLPAAR